MLITVFGVFVLPIARIIAAPTAERLFGLSVILFAGYQLALLGHYKLLFHGPTKLPGRYCTLDEALFILLTLAVSALYLALSFEWAPFGPRLAGC